MNRAALYQIAEKWFESQNWKPFAFQKQTWKAFLQGKNGLLNAPTGSGKTYALWFPILLNYIQQRQNKKAIWIESHLDYTFTSTFHRNQTSC